MRRPDYILRRQSVHFRCPNDRAVKNLPPVGASIARPLLAGGAIRIENGAYRLCAIPTAGGCREANRFESGGYSYCRCPTGNNGSILFCTRVLFHIFANFHRRTANGRPYGSVILERRFTVGASIARPLLPEGQFALRMASVAIAVSRPVTME